VLGSGRANIRHLSDGRWMDHALCLLKDLQVRSDEPLYKKM